MKKYISIFLTIGALILSSSLGSATVLADSLNDDTDVLDEAADHETKKLTFTPNPKFVEFLENTNREVTVQQTDKGIRIVVYNYSGDPSGHPIPPLKMTVPSGWQIMYSIEAIDPSPQTVGEGIVNGNGYFIYYVLVEKTGNVVYTENEILDWYLSMDIGHGTIIKDDTGTMTEEMKARLTAKFEQQYPDNYLVNFTVEYSSDDDFNYDNINDDYLFKVYYKDVLVYDQFESNSRVFLGIRDGEDYEAVFKPEFVEACKYLYFGNLIGEESAKQILKDAYKLSDDDNCDTQLVIYNYLTGMLGSDKAILAYKIRLTGNHPDIEYIIDAHSGEIIQSNSSVVPSQNKMPGDVNLDGKIGISDVVMLQKWISGVGDLTCRQNADLNEDGKINVFDCIMLKRKVMKNMQSDKIIDYSVLEQQ